MGPLKSSSVNPSITGKYVGSFAAFFSPGRRACRDGATKLFRIMLLFVSSPFLKRFRRRRREGSTARRVTGNDLAEHARVEGRGRVGGLCEASWYLIPWCHLLGHPSCSFALNGTKKKKPSRTRQNTPHIRHTDILQSAR